MPRLLSVIVTASSLAVAGSAAAQSVSLAFNALPSAQGFTYAAGGAGTAYAEGDLFQADGSSLNQDTLGIDTSSSGGNYYFRGVILDPSGDYTLSTDVTLRGYEGQDFGGGSIYPYGLSFGLAGTYFGIAGERLGLYSAGGGVQYLDFPVGFSPFGSHSYVQSRSGGITSFSIDGTTVFSGVLIGVGAGDQLLLGDATGFANAAGSFSRFDFVTGGGVPEPASWAMMIAGFGLVAGGMRTRRRKVAFA